jgi:hypothetical protein
MSLFARVVLGEAEVGIYKEKKYRVLGYEQGAAGKLVRLAWFSDPTKAFKVAADKVKIEKQGGAPAAKPKAVPAATHAKPPTAVSPWLAKQTTLGWGVKVDHKNKVVDMTNLKLPRFDSDGGAEAHEAFSQETMGAVDDLVAAGYTVDK